MTEATCRSNREGLCIDLHMGPSTDLERLEAHSLIMSAFGPDSAGITTDDDTGETTLHLEWVDERPDFQDISDGNGGLNEMSLGHDVPPRMLFIAKRFPAIYGEPSEMTRPGAVFILGNGTLVMQGNDRGWVSVSNAAGHASRVQKEDGQWMEDWTDGKANRTLSFKELPDGQRYFGHDQTNTTRPILVEGKSLGDWVVWASGAPLTDRESLEAQEQERMRNEGALDRELRDSRLASLFTDRESVGPVDSLLGGQF